MCLYQNNWDEFITYFSQVRNECFNDEDIKSDFKTCTKSLFEKSVPKKIQVEISDCINLQSVESKRTLTKNDDDIKYYLINYSPIVFINGYMYKGNYRDPDHLMEAFCNSFEEMPLKCHNLQAFT